MRQEKTRTLAYCLCRVVKTNLELIQTHTHTHLWYILGHEKGGVKKYSKDI
jgi:hypothetical protein